MPPLHQQQQLCRRPPPPQRHHRPPPPQRVAVAARASLSRRAVLATASGLSCSCCRCGWYDSLFACSMAKGMEAYEAAVQPVKAPLFQQLLQPLTGSASALEVGIGTGPNLPFYSSTAGSPSNLSLRLTGLEPNTAMWPYAEAAVAAAGQPAVSLQLVEGDAQAMPFDAASFDAAVITLVLCSVAQPQRVLAEVARVLKPGGQLLLIEHVVAQQLGLLQLQQRLLDPLQQLLADRCHLTRDTAAVLHTSGLVLQPLPPLPAGVWGLPGRASVNSRDLWRFEVEGMGLIAPHIAAILRKPL